MKDNKLTDDQELDLNALRQRMGNAFESLNMRVFLILQFFIRNIAIVGVLFVVGVGLGFYLDRTQKTYDHELTVMPNFNSVDYLYGKINLLESKIVKGDTAFLKNVVGLKHPKKLLKIEIKPIIDVYNFAGRTDSNYEMLKVMSEDGSVKKIIEDPVTAKNYPNHLIMLRTKDAATVESTIEPILKYLNNSPFYAKLQVEHIKSVKDKIASNERTIAQIDGILDSYAIAGGGKTPGMVYYNNENTQLNDVIETKDKLVREQTDLRIAQINYDRIIKDQGVDLNIDNTEVIEGKMKLILPILFIGIFVLIRMFVSFYRKQSAKLKAQAE